MIVNRQLVKHKAICIVISLEILVVNTILLENYSQMVIFIHYIRFKGNIADLLSKVLNRELVENSLTSMGLKPIKE